jgi:hypothetical protein
MPYDQAGRYVAAAYLVFMFILILYVAIMAMRLGRIQKDVALIDEMLQAKDDHTAKAANKAKAAADAGDGA